VVVGGEVGAGVDGAGVEVGLGVTGGNSTWPVVTGVEVGTVITWPQPHSNSAIIARATKRVLIFATPSQEVLYKSIIPDRSQIGKNWPCQIREIVLHLGILSIHEKREK